MPKLTHDQLGLTDVHTHAGAIDLYNLFKTRSPMTQNIRDLVLKAKLNDIAHLVVFPMPMPFYYNPIQVIHNQTWQPSGFEEFPYQLSNKALLYEAETFGEGMILPFMMIHPKEKVNEQIEFLKEVISLRNVYGLKLHTRATATTPNDLINSPFIDILKEHDLPILIHSRSKPETTSASRILELAKCHSDIRICVAHLADLDRDVLTQIKDAPNVYVDCTPFLSICNFAKERDYNFVSQQLFDANYRDPAQCLIELNNFMPGKLLWGTDEPWTIVSKPDGTLITNYTYADECAVLAEISRKGHDHTRRSIAQMNTARFLFG